MLLRSQGVTKTQAVKTKTPQIQTPPYHETSDLEKRRPGSVSRKLRILILLLQFSSVQLTVAYK